MHYTQYAIQQNKIKLDDGWFFPDLEIRVPYAVLFQIRVCKTL